MAAGTAFVDILDEMLAEMPIDRSAAQPNLRPLPPNPFLFAEPHRHYRAPYGSLGRTSGASRDVPTAEAAPINRPPAAPAAVPPPTTAFAEAPRTTRKLSPADERAVEALAALGARLPKDFTAAELRSAFRALARKYHPDTHPSSDRAQSTRLARVFADVNAHYQQLQRALDTPA